MKRCRNVADWLKIRLTWVGSTVSGLVVLVGAISIVIAASMIMAGKDAWAVFFSALAIFCVILGLAGIVMSAIIRRR